jgi:signal transduction histidine kinase
MVVGMVEGPLSPWQRRRALTLFVASAGAFTAALIQGLAGARSFALLGWPVTAGVVTLLGGFGLWRGSPKARLWATLALSAFLLLSAPLAYADGGHPTDLVVLIAQPLALMIIFMDQPSAVRAIAPAGFLINLAALAAFRFGSYELLHLCLSMCLLYGVGALEFERLRRLDAERAEALQRATVTQLHSERLVMLGTLAAGVAHEVNNPLSYVIANLNALEHSHASLSHQDLQELWAETNSGLTRIRELVRDIRGFSRKDHEDGPIDLHETLRTPVRIASLRSHAKVKIHIEIPDAVPPVQGSSMRLAQVVLNLLVNSCDAIELAGRASGNVWVRVVTAPREVRLLVDDDGPGLAPEVVEHLFEPFFTTKGADRGTGMGLSLSSKFVEEMGGRLSAEPRPDGGARFVVTLPHSNVVSAAAAT